MYESPSIPYPPWLFSFHYQHSYDLPSLYFLYLVECYNIFIDGKKQKKIVMDWIGNVPPYAGNRATSLSLSPIWFKKMEEDRQNLQRKRLLAHWDRDPREVDKLRRPRTQQDLMGRMVTIENVRHSRSGRHQMVRHPKIHRSVLLRSI